MENNTSNQTKGINKMPLLETAEQEAARLAPLRQEIVKSYEIIMEICRQANVPESARNLIDALIRISGGELYVKTYDAEVARVFFENEPMREALKKKVQRWRKKLDEWQTKSNITLVQIKSGHRTYERGENGEEKPINHPCEYNVIILDTASKVLELGNMPVEQAARKILGELPSLPSRLDEKRKRPMSTERARKSSLSFMRRALEIAKEQGYLPEVVSELKEDVTDLLSEYDAAAKTNSSYSKSEGKTNDYTINTLFSFSSFSNDVDKSEGPNSEVFDNEYQNQSASLTLQGKSMMSHALDLARKGFRVFPVHTVIDGICSCTSGAECNEKGKHPRIMAFQFDATTDESKIKEWWRNWRTANIGIPTGEFNNQNIVVLDVDPKHGGFESLKTLEIEFGNLPQTLTAITGSNGRHFIFFAPEGVEITNLQASAKLGNGLDVRGKHGFIVAAGSVHVSGNRYQWLDEDVQVAEMPAWMIEKLTAQIKKPVTQTVNAIAGDNNSKANVSFTNFHSATEAVINEGGRNDFLFSKSIGLFHNGYGKDEVVRRVSKWNSAACVPPVELEELTKLINSAENTSLKGY